MQNVLRIILSIKKLLGIVVLGLLLSGCAYEYEPPKPDFAGTLGSYNYEVYLKYREWGGCEAVLNLKNNNSKIQTVYVELTAFDDKGKNVDMTNFIISNLSKNETAERDSAFTRVSCYDIKKLRISIKDY